MVRYQLSTSIRASVSREAVLTINTYYALRHVFDCNLAVQTSFARHTARGDVCRVSPS